MGEKVYIDPHADTAEQAAHWLARMLDPACAAEERAAFERWCASDARNAVAYHRMQRLWDDGGAIVQEDPALNEASRRALAHRAPAHPARRRWVPALACGALAAAAVAVVWHRGPVAIQPVAGTEYATAVGERRDLTLEDRSSVILDTQTRLVERYGPGERRVDLRQGQAEFQVQGDPQRPFVVHTEGGTVTAVGTRFQVRQDPIGTLVTLLEGAVEVRADVADTDDARRSVSLHAGERVTLDRDGRLGAVQPADLKAALGWTEGKLFVDDWRLQDLVTEINRYSDVQLQIDDPALRDLVVSGVFRTHDRDKLARVLDQGWGIRARPISARNVLLTRE